MIRILNRFLKSIRPPAHKMKILGTHEILGLKNGALRDWRVPENLGAGALGRLRRWGP